MQINSESLVFEIPDSWEYFSEGGRLVCHGPSGQELIVSVTAVYHEGGVGFEGVVDQVYSNAVVTVREMLADPELETVRNLSPEPGPLMPSEVALSRSKDGSVFFSQVVVKGSSAVMLATLETPISEPHTTILLPFLRSVRSA